MTVLPRSITPPTADAPVSAPPLPPAPQTALQRALDAPDTPFTRWLVRWRRWFFVGIALLIVAQFNGQWRLGLDTSIYRGVADNLAAGRGYTFAGRTQTQVYPGLPVMLAGIEVLFQTKKLVYPLLLMNGLALLTLWGVYQLIQQRYPKWVAVAVTCGVGVNSRFLQQAQEIMTDTPFLCAVVFSLLAWEWLGSAKTRRRTAGAAAMLLVSLFVAATMRPTFWVLAVAWGMVAAYHGVVRRERRSLVALGVLVVVGIAFVALDPRVHGMSLLQGSYEKELFQNAGGLGAKLAKNGPNLLFTELPEAFFNELMTLHVGGRVIYGSLPFVVLIGIGAIIVVRRQPLWGLQVFILTGVMLMLSDVPRYYLMVLPTLWLAYTLAALWVTSRFKPAVRDVALFGLFSVANFQNLGGAVSLAREQHADDFLHEYKHGNYKKLIALAKTIESKVPADKVVVAPNAQVLAYFGDRQVLNGRLLGFDTAKPARFPALVAAAGPAYMVGGPLTAFEKDPELYQLIKRGVLVPGKLVAWSGDMWLAETRVEVPADDWRQAPKVTPHPVDPAARPRHAETPQAAANRRIKQERADRGARIERNKLKNARAERADRLARNLRKQRKTRRAATRVSFLGNPKSEIRNQKSESNPKPNDEAVARDASVSLAACGRLGADDACGPRHLSQATGLTVSFESAHATDVRPSSFGFDSDFWFRISNFSYPSPRPPPEYRPTPTDASMPA